MVVSVERRTHGNLGSFQEVWLDVDDQTNLGWGSSCIRWADGNVTQSGKLCRHGA